MSSNVPVAEATRDEAVLPERVQEALGQLVGAAKEGLLALSVGVGLGVLTELMEEEVDDVVGPKGKWNPDRSAVRHGHEGGEVTLGGRRVEVERPRVRTVGGEAEVPLRTSYSAPSMSILTTIGAWARCSASRSSIRTARTSTGCCHGVKRRVEDFQLSTPPDE